MGSLRKASLSRKVAHALVERAPSSLRAHIVEIGDLALYNEDLDTGSPPEPWVRFRDAIAKADGVVWVTPEYNRSIPACLKNALDVGTRPPKRNVFDGKPAAIVSVTPYKLGGMAANHALRQAFVFPNLLVMQQPEAYVSSAAELFDDAGTLESDDTSKFLTQFMTAFASWIDKTGAKDATSFDAFMKEREKAAAAYVSGDAAAVHALATSSDPATFFHPGGEVVQGAKAVVERYDADARQFDKGGTTRLEVLQSSASGDLGFWTGYQHAEARMRGKPDSVAMKLRITEVFRREGGAWKMVHRHAEPVKQAK